MVARMGELNEAVTQELLQKHSRDKYTELSKDVKVGRFRKETEAKHQRLKKMV